MHWLGKAKGLGVDPETQVEGSSTLVEGVMSEHCICEIPSLTVLENMVLQFFKRTKN